MRSSHIACSLHPGFLAASSPPLPSHAQVLETLKDPLQTLIQGREPEVVYAVLSNFLVLAQRYPLLFSQVSGQPGVWRAGGVGMQSMRCCATWCCWRSAARELRSSCGCLGFLPQALAVHGLGAMLCVPCCGQSLHLSSCSATTMLSWPPGPPRPVLAVAAFCPTAVPWVLLPPPSFD